MKVYHGRRMEHGCAVDVEEHGERSPSVQYFDIVLGTKRSDGRVIVVGHLARDALT
jgi:hypothetical protein